MGKLTIGNLEKCPIPPGGAPSPPSLGKTIISQGSMTRASNWYISDSQLRKSNFYQLTEHLGEEPTPPLKRLWEMKEIKLFVSSLWILNRKPLPVFGF